MSKNLNTQWRVERRLSRKHKWVKAGLFETREAARHRAAVLRHPHFPIYPKFGELQPGYGFGNTRVVKYVKGAK